jgi:uncharacterized protein (TIRG00374 family)
VLVGAAVIAVLTLRSDIGELWETVRSADVRWFVGALVAVIAGFVASALRWRAYLDVLDLPLRYGSLFRLYFVGVFFNAFLPTGLGGDAYKAVRLGRGTKPGEVERSSFAAAVASVFLDRFAGAVAIAAFGLVASLALIATGETGRLPTTALVLSVGVAVATAVLLLGGERLLGKGHVVPDRGLGRSIRRGARAIHQAARHPQAAARGYFFSLIFQALILAANAMVARSLGTRISVGNLSCILVVTGLITIVPLTINGLGVREGAYVWSLGLVGIDNDRAFAFALLILIVGLLASAIGGIVYVTGGGNVSLREGVPTRRPPAPAGSD